MRYMRWTLAVVMAVSAISAHASSAGAQDTRVLIRGELLSHFNASIGKVIALAEAVPQDRYDWRPDSETMSVARVYAHIARYNYYYPQSSLASAPPAGLRLDTLETMRDKAQIVQLLKQSADHVRRVIREMPAEQLEASTTLYGRSVPRWAVMLQLVAHMNEHLGQSIAYARSNKIVPPWSR
jgi:uncharacterized damage-inducible protein DinB